MIDFLRTAIDELLTKYQIKLVQLPRISVDDPVVNMLGGKLNDVVKIERRSETAVEKSYYYRFVVKLA